MSAEKTFPDDLNIYVFTTRFVIENNSPIILVSHDDEGDWQFLSEEGPIESEARVVLLSEIIKHDSSILQIADLPVNAKAFRDSPTSPWRVKINSVRDN